MKLGILTQRSTVTPPQAAIKHLLVDEFQDGNTLQHRLIRKWSDSCESLFVIGDPDQSIYGFRGASADCFSQLREDYPQLREISLHKNYRSAPAILQAALPVIQGNAGQARMLEAQRTAGEKVQLRHEDAGFHEALFVVKEIDALVGGIDMLQAHNNKRKHATSSPSYGFNDIAVLYRTRRQAEIIEQCLQKEGIPYVTSGREDYFSDATVLDTLAFFRFILSPSDIFSLRRCMLFCGISAPTAQKIFHDYAQGKRNLAALDKICASLAETESFRQLLSYYAGRCRKEKTG